MTRTSTTADLFVVAIQDLLDATQAWIERSDALCGAFRKGKQSKRISYETAIHLAERLGDARARGPLNACREEEIEADARLEQLLVALAEAM